MTTLQRYKYGYVSDDGDMNRSLRLIKDPVGNVCLASDAADRIETLTELIRKVHKAKGRYHTQIAMCDLFDAVGLKNERPTK